jgi:hypothetical protein
MKINDDHLLHGAALTHIAEHTQFTAINTVRITGALSRSAFRINDSIGIYLKYALEPKAPSADYIFTFNKDNKSELTSLSRQYERLFIIMVCYKHRQICSLHYSELQAWLNRRRRALGKDEHTSTILVGLAKGKAFRVNMNQPGRRKVYLDTPQLVPRIRFPDCLFGE